MILDVAEFIRRFLLHVLPKGFHRLRHYGLLAGGKRDERLAQARELLQAPARTGTDAEGEATADAATGSALATPCPCCGGRMIVIETFQAGAQPKHAPTIRIDVMTLPSAYRLGVVPHGRWSQAGDDGGCPL